MSALLTSRVVARFAWWDDAVFHAHWLAARTGLRYRVYRPRGYVAWRVCVAMVRGGPRPMGSPGLVRVAVECDGCGTKDAITATNVNDGQHELNGRGWMRNDKLDRDFCPACSQVRVGFYGVDKRLL